MVGLLHQEVVLTKECAEEGSEHRVWEGCKQGTELANHAQAQHECGAILDHSAAANLWAQKLQITCHSPTQTASPGQT